MSEVIEAMSAEELTQDEVNRVVGESLSPASCDGKKLLLIVPDSTRTAPVGMMFKAIHSHAMTHGAAKVDVLVALGTHPPMPEEAICGRLEISLEERQTTYEKVALLNHAWDDPSQLKDLGVIPKEEIRDLSGGLFEMDVPVEINKLLFDYDRIIIVGPVFPHEVVGFSGGNKYLFPGVAGPGILNFFHWLGAVVTNPMIIGTKWTPVRKVVDRAGAMVDIPKSCFCMVVDGKRFAGLHAGTPEAAWDSASEQSRSLHILTKLKPFHTVLSCCPPMYDELWTAGKCMYKLEPVVADGGELIIYAPHLEEISITHGELICELGYHCRDYFLKQWEKFKDYPWGVVAHSTHVRGIGTYENDEEKCRVKVTLASRVPEDVCHAINLGYRNPDEINPADFMNKEDEGILYVAKAGEQLYHLEDRPDWAGGK